MTEIEINGKLTKSSISNQQSEYDFPIDNSTQEITQPTELGEALRELNQDNLDEKGMSGIDMRSNLHPAEISAILEIDTLVSFGFLPPSCLNFTRQKKRLMVSKDGKGRNDIVNVIGGKQEQDVKKGAGGFFGNIGNMMGGGKK